MRFTLGIVALALLTLPAQAFDCGKASTANEKAICADPALKAADDAMSQAYGQLRDMLSGTDKKMLALSQRYWLRYRDNVCQGTGDELSQCLLKATQARQDFLAAKPQSGPGTGSTMVPVIIARDGSRKLYELDVALVRFAKPASPGEKLFNTEIDKLLKEVPKGQTDAVAPQGGVLSFQANAALSYASPKLISAAITSWSYDGGAHGNGGLSNINVDLAKGQLLRFDDVFTSAALPELTKDCVAQIMVKKQQGWGDGKYDPAQDSNYHEKDVKDGVGDLSKWSLSAGSAMVTFNAYEIGAYAEGDFQCNFSADRLKPFVKPDAVYNP